MDRRANGAPADAAAEVEPEGREEDEATTSESEAAAEPEADRERVAEPEPEEAPAAKSEIEPKKQPRWFETVEAWTTPKQEAPKAPEPPAPETSVLEPPTPTPTPDPEPQPDPEPAEQVEEPEPATDEPAVVEVPSPAPARGLRARALLRRRARYLRRVRELQLRDIGGFLVELNRFGRERPDLLRDKVEAAQQTDDELRALDAVLDRKGRVRDVREAGIGGTCQRCGAIFGSTDNFCASCGAELDPGARR